MRTEKNSDNPISPVIQFTLLLTPMVMSCFFVVYALTGFILDGRDKFNWSLEAPTVSLWVGAGIVAFSLIVMAYARIKGAKPMHPLNMSSLGHIVLALLLTVSVFFVANL